MRHPNLCTLTPMLPSFDGTAFAVPLLDLLVTLPEMLARG